MAAWVTVVSVSLALSCAHTSARQASPDLRPQAGSTHVAAPAPTLAFLPQTRLLRLHLVRPDLIPYPIELEFDC